MVRLIELSDDGNPLQSQTTRHRCSACYKQYKNKEHLVRHMEVSYHSVHQPRCGVCHKYCQSFESLREHITGPLPKADCAKIFSARGCELCMNIFDTSAALSSHKEICSLRPAPSIEFVEIPSVGIDSFEVETSSLDEGCDSNRLPEAIALDCEMVGGGSDGTLNLCARVCLIDENENVVFHAYVEPELPVTDYRYEITGIKEEHLRDAMPLKEVKEIIEKILYNGESIWKTRLVGGKAKLLVGHEIMQDLKCLRMGYPDHLFRDTAKYRPLMKTNLASHSLKYLAKTYLGYEIQSGTHDPYEDCVATMRLYKRMRAQAHPTSDSTSKYSPGTNNFDGRSTCELLNMSPDALFEISGSNYACWCLDLESSYSAHSETQSQTRFPILETTPPELNSDVVLHISSRLPIKSVLQCRRVCRIWRYLFEKPKIGMLFGVFAKRHEHGVDIELYYREESSETVNLNCTEKYQEFYSTVTKMGNMNITGTFFSLVGSCNGLVCYITCEDLLGGVMYISNPITGERIRVSKNGAVYDYTGFGYCHFTDAYKVVRICYGANGKQRVQVYTLGDSRWRNKQEVTYTMREPGVFANGALYWLSAKSNSFDIVAFDLADETFQSVPSPVSRLPPVTYMNVTLGGDLCLCCQYMATQGERMMDIWVFKNQNMNIFRASTAAKEPTDFNSFAWIKVFSEKWESGSNCQLLSSTENEILLWQNCVLSCYDLKAKTLTNLWYVEGGFVQATPHMHSLVSLKDLGEKLVDG